MTYEEVNKEFKALGCLELLIHDTPIYLVGMDYSKVPLRTCGTWFTADNDLMIDSTVVDYSTIRIIRLSPRGDKYFRWYGTYEEALVKIKELNNK